MSNVPPPLLGFNNNVRHRGRIFHIQTEDSGIKNPRIVTHLFADGGRIIKTTRTDYAEHVSRADMQVFVRSLMKEQHKRMFTALRLGELDPLLENVCGPFEQPAQAMSKAPPSMVTAPPPPESFSEPLLTEPAPPPETDSETPSSASFTENERPSEAARRRKRGPLSNPNLRKVTPSVPPAGLAFELDAAAIDRLPAPASVSGGSLQRTPQPPSARPPRKSNPAPARKSRPSPAQPASSKNGGPPPSLSRPSSRFAAVPSKSAQSIFGDGVISEQSLDEVILSYLAEDLDGSSD